MNRGRNDRPLWIATLGMENGAPIAYASPGQDVTVIRSTPYPASLGDLLTWMERTGLSQLWLHPSWYDAAHLADETAYQNWLELGAGWTMKSKSPVWMKCYHEGTWAERAVVLPSLESRAEWRKASDALRLLKAILRYNTLLGFPYRSSPGATGTALIRALHSRPGSTDITRCEHIPEIAKEGDLEGVFLWSRQPRDDELKANSYLHVYDKNAQFLGACSSLMLGVGEPTEAQHWPTDGDWLQRPGYWHIRTDPEEAYPNLPDPIRPGLAEGEPWTWVTTPTLRLALELGIIRDLDGAWIWRESHRMLETWYKRLRDARTALYDDILITEGAEYVRVALDALKSTYTYTFGWMGLTDYWLADREPGDLWRPDWRHAVVGQARANLYRNLMGLEGSGYSPLAINYDAIAILSTVEDPVAGHPPCLRLGTDLGAFKVKASIPLALIRHELDAMRAVDAHERWRGWRAIEAAMKEHS